MPLRLLLAPLALPALLRHSLVGLGRPVLHARVDARHPLPSEACLRALVHARVGGLHLRLVGVHAGWARTTAPVFRRLDVAHTLQQRSEWAR